MDDEIGNRPEFAKVYPVDAIAAITRLGGVSAYQPLVALVGRRTLQKALVEGRVVRARRGVYTLPAADEAAVAAHDLGGVVSHLSAALAHGWKVKSPPALPHVTVPHNSRKSSDRVRLHYLTLDAEECQGSVTTPARTAIDCARELPFDEALAVVDSALRSRQVTRDQLLAAAAQSSRKGRTRAMRVIRAGDAAAANPFESVLRAIARDVPGFCAEPQGPVSGVGHADVADVRLRIALEAESWEFHALREAFNYDIRRYTAMVRRGWLVVRFTWDDVMHKPDYVRAVIADLVAIRAQVQEIQALSR